MRLVLKLIKRTSNSEQGFVLIVAIMAIVILTAIGFFALTMISGDLMISSRLTGERKALSAAESGVHAIYASSFSIIDLVNAYPTSTPSRAFRLIPQMILLPVILSQNTTEH